MKFLSDRMTSASGSIGGSTFSHNRFGMYTRARRVPVNPNTTFQQSQRDAFSSASALWRTISDAERASWEAYAAATPVVNSLGQTVFLSGSQQFVASASLALRFGMSTTNVAPVTPGRAALGMPTLVLDASANTGVAASFDAAAENATVGIFLGDPVSAGVSFFAGPYQLRGSGTVTAGTFTVATIGGRGGMALIAGQRIPFRMAGLLDTENNRLTQVVSGIVTVVA